MNNTIRTGVCLSIALAFALHNTTDAMSWLRGYKSPTSTLNGPQVSARHFSSEKDADRNLKNLTEKSTKKALKTGKMLPLIYNQSKLIWPYKSVEISELADFERGSRMVKEEINKIAYIFEEKKIKHFEISSICHNEKDVNRKIYDYFISPLVAKSTKRLKILKKLQAEQDQVETVQINTENLKNSTTARHFSSEKDADKILKELTEKSTKKALKTGRMLPLVYNQSKLIWPYKSVEISELADFELGSWVVKEEIDEIAYIFNKNKIKHSDILAICNNEKNVNRKIYYYFISPLVAKSTKRLKILKNLQAERAQAEKAQIDTKKLNNNTNDLD